MRSESATATESLVEPFDKMQGTVTLPSQNETLSLQSFFNETVCYSMAAPVTNAKEAFGETVATSLGFENHAQLKSAWKRAKFDKKDEKGRNIWVGKSYKHGAFSSRNQLHCHCCNGYAAAWFSSMLTPLGTGTGMTEEEITQTVVTHAMHFEGDKLLEISHMTRLNTTSNIGKNAACPFNNTWCVLSQAGRRHHPHPCHSCNLSNSSTLSPPGLASRVEQPFAIA